MTPPKKKAPEPKDLVMAFISDCAVYWTVTEIAPATKDQAALLQVQVRSQEGPLGGVTLNHAALTTLCQGYLEDQGYTVEEPWGDDDG